MTQQARTESRPTSTEKTVLVLGAAFAALEGYDLACYGVTVPSLLADPGFGADKASAGTAGSLVAIGMMIGAALAAVLVGRWGNLRLLVSGAGVFSAAMLVCAAVPSVVPFGAARFVVGLGLGAVLPTVTAYVAEMSAPERRSRNVGIMMGGYALGALLAPLLGAALLPHGSWRWIYVIGAVPALVLLPLALRKLSAANGTPVEQHDLLALRGLLRPGLRAVTLLFWAMSFCGLLLVFGISTWLPTIMQAAGYSLGSSLLQTAAMWVGAGTGMIAGGWLADRVGIKPVVVAAFLAGAVALLLMSIDPPTVLLFVLMFVSGLGFIGSQVLTNAFIVTRYPPDVRAAGISWALAVGRLGAIAGPLLGALTLASGLGVAWNFYLFVVPGVIGAALAAAVPVDHARAEVRRADPG
jgi:MFS transporter, AAHS family, benzoate transport protein